MSVFGTKQSNLDSSYASLKDFCSRMGKAFVVPVMSARRR